MRYIIGIDLGTTNSSVAYVDTEKQPLSIQMFPIPQLTASGKVDPLLTLPSFCYLVNPNEWPPGTLKLPWKEETALFVGQFAKTQGAKVPTRLIQSAKSWLCNVAANRRDKILPIETADLSQRLSPVEASAKYLTHLKEAWNATFAKGDSASEFEEQEIILTVPASFDEVARSLTIEAARLAGLQHVTLLEEPQAAFYSWISQHEQKWQNILKAGDRILVCDVGGGTTDFSLIEVHSKETQLVFQRMAVGDHLLLGGDNMDVALAHFLEKRMQEEGKPSLESLQWLYLKAEARAAKEELLSSLAASDASYSVVIQGTGASVVGGSLTTSIQRKELEDFLLHGFFGQYDQEEALELRKSRGFRTMGLPYEDEPSITKHLAHFLQQAGCLNSGQSIQYVLFNGGTMQPSTFQQAIHHVLCRWFKTDSISILPSVSLDLAVARGAAYYGKVRRGLGVAIGGGSPRTYYLEVDVKDSQGKISQKALTLLPRGSEEGSQFRSEQTFLLRPNTPVSFHVLTSHVRLHDRQGELIPIDEQEMQLLPPIHTILRFGRRQISNEQQETIPVRLGIALTAIGTIELWLESQQTEHRWSLEFQLKSASGQENSLLTMQKQQRQDETFTHAYLEEAKQLIEETFTGTTIKPGQLMEKLEERLGINRREWSPSLLRQLWDPLLKVIAQRKRSSDYEARWWNVVGFMLRPGFGFPLDDFRIKELWKIILQDLKNAVSSDVQIQKWICYRRLSGGFNKGQQVQLASEIMAQLFDKRTGKIVIKSKSEEYTYSEKIRALASFERIELPLKIRLGEAILERIMKNEAISADLWALARIGARHLVYGSIGQVVPKDICSKWVERLLERKGDNTDLKFIFSQLARKTDHRELNLPDSLLNRIINQDPTGELRSLILEERSLTQSEQEQILGDRLPAGLILEM